MESRKHQPSSDQPTRREAVVRITGAGAATALGASIPEAYAQETYTPKALSSEQFEILTLLVDMIIPRTDTPGAADVGVDRKIDEELGEGRISLMEFLGGLSQIEQAGFAELDKAKRVALLEEYAQALDDRGDFFKLLKGLTVDHYYSSKVGLLEELAYEGNTALAEFPGCTHDEHR